MRTMKIYHDLDHLSRNWTDQDAQEFEKNIKIFETIDEEFWVNPRMLSSSQITKFSHKNFQSSF